MDGPVPISSMKMTMKRRKAIYLGSERTRNSSPMREWADIEELPDNWRAKNNLYFLAYPKLTEPSRVTLLSLPLELRRLIYTFVLGEDSGNHSAFHRLIGDPSYSSVFPSDIWVPFYRQKPPPPFCCRLASQEFPCFLHGSTSVGNFNAYSLLLSNRQIHQDFAFFLYDTCTFHLQDPTSASIWLWNIGANIENVRKLHVRVGSTRYDRESWKAWYDIFQQLAEHAMALRFLRISFDENPESERMHSLATRRLYGLESGHINPSAGEDTTLMSAVGEIRTLRRIELAGEISETWPRYLRRATDAGVLEVRKEDCEVCYPKPAEFSIDDFRSFLFMV